MTGPPRDCRAGRVFGPAAWIGQGRAQRQPASTVASAEQAAAGDAPEYARAGAAGHVAVVGRPRAHAAGAVDVGDVSGARPAQAGRWAAHEGAVGLHSGHTAAVISVAVRMDAASAPRVAQLNPAAPPTSVQGWRWSDTKSASKPADSVSIPCCISASGCHAACGRNHPVRAFELTRPPRRTGRRGVRHHLDRTAQADQKVMGVTLRFVSVVSGDISLLPCSLSHYRELGVEIFHSIRHVESRADPTPGPSVEVRREGGYEFADVCSAPWHEDLNATLIRKQMSVWPDGWWIVADLDEFHVYDRSPAEVAAY